MIAIIDYEMGNLRSVQKAFEKVGNMAVVTRDPAVIDRASHVVLPGVGAFGDCMANLERYGLLAPLYRVIGAGKPFLGICLGFQVLFSQSEEFGLHRGLDILPGTVKRFSPPQETAVDWKIPHMGWNAIDIYRSPPPLQGIAPGSFVYFVHSFYVEPSDPTLMATKTDYQIPFVSSVWKDHIFATQFHPEKSQEVGLHILRNFGDWQ